MAVQRNGVVERRRQARRSVQAMWGIARAAVAAGESMAAAFAPGLVKAREAARRDYGLVR
ncbi:hypothetical protein GCM10027079_02610 [Sediminivirga luteola]|uniref:Uncharacterized protein n=1 Tax=Sediminivirga luteola TaxID=1774748 RepID=A0A8J2XEX4_9MICO|nr:hypothetical protein GCM10011333_12040 [Sediminivirga luteola]